MADDFDLLHAAWTLEQGRDKNFRVPADYDFPLKFIQADITDAYRINSWELETLLVEALGNSKRPGRRSANPKNWNFFADAISVLRVAENSEHGVGSPNDLFRNLTRTFYRQFSWQARHSNLADIVRWQSIFRNKELDDAYRSRTGVNARKVIALGVALSHLFQKRAYISPPPATPVLDLSGDEIKAIFSILSAPLAAFRERSANIVQRSQLAFRESPFRMTPLASRETPAGTVYICPLKETLFWRTTSGLYYDVAGHVRAKHLIGSEFEIFQRRLLKAAYPAATVAGDEPYGRPKESKRTPDITIVSDGRVRLAFECKAKRLRLSDQISLSSDDNASLGIQELAKGVFQLARFRSELRKGVIPNLSESRDAQYVVLTLDDWAFTGGTTKGDVLKQAAKFINNKNIELDFELEDIVFCTAAELDMLVVRLSLDQMIDLFSKNREPEFCHHAASSLASDFHQGRVVWSSYPLADEFNIV